jgi:uncharacterized protein (DUF2062 family)
MKFLSDKLSCYWDQIKYFCVHKILHADDPPHKLALGIAVGLFVALLPLIGVQMMLSVILAWAVRANKAVGVALVWISNPFTMVFLYYPGYWIGCRFMGLDPRAQWVELIQGGGFNPSSIKSLSWEKVAAKWDNITDFIAPLFLGTFIVATVAGIISYYISLYIIRTYRLKRWGQLMPPSLTPEDAGIDNTSGPFPPDSSTENAA